MNRTSESNVSEVGGTGEQLQRMSRRRALAGLSLALTAVPFAAPAVSQAQGRRAGGNALRHVRNKRVVAEFLERMTSVDRAAALRQNCYPDCRFEVFHPFNTLVGVEAAEATFWEPLKASFPDHEHRIAFTIAGEYEGRDMVSTWGQVMGTFDEPWIGIPPTRGLAFLRFGFAGSGTSTAPCSCRRSLTAAGGDGNQADCRTHPATTCGSATGATLAPAVGPR